MKTRAVVAVALGVLSAVGPAVAQTPLGTAFTYQGRLTDNGVPVTGTYEVQLRLFDAATGGSQVGATLTQAGVTVTQGLFTVPADFGPSAFAGSRRWMEVSVRPTGGGAFVPLSPRQLLAPAPNAVYATTAGTALTEADPKVGATTAGSWCVGNGTQVSCTTAPPVTSESDPQVGAVLANNWCRANGIIVNCDRAFPTTCPAGQYLRGDGGCFDIGPHRFSGSIAPGGSATIGLGAADLGQVITLVFGDAITQANYTMFTGMANDGNTAIKGFSFETGRTTVLSTRLSTTDTTTNQYTAAHGFGIVRGGGTQGSVVVFNNHPTLSMFYVATIGPSDGFRW